MDEDLSDRITFNFRLADGSPIAVSAGAYFKTHFRELFRSLRAKHGWFETIGFDARPDVHPDVVAETAELRRRLHEARLARGWTPPGRAAG